MDSINDKISIYVDRLPDGKILLNDDGYTLNNLEMLGIAWTSSKKELLDEVCQRFKLKIIEEETLAIQGNKNEFSLMKDRLISAILQINELAFTQH
ncbi:DUF1828 domain-containing protein [Limosilactobacillus sp.]|uniref:DUF1828 domain-containing protein n=1 Tax=Limosilactobacillus sp. TaxID=2773925 RepID=UPI0025C3CA3B|nr:DUF1828 domain-containing protein [Limosilactobacillus sp.]MCH3921880.1 DUF1828 domain-containing protein [Limosilactobacillus sp.]MCH3928651.1 DUF1828 domain-containing protein [Limosilactobacillus sp.]